MACTRRLRTSRTTTRAMIVSRIPRSISTPLGVKVTLTVRAVKRIVSVAGDTKAQNGLNNQYEFICVICASLALRIIGCDDDFYGGLFFASSRRLCTFA